MLTSQYDFRLISFGEDEVSAEYYARAERVYLESIGAMARTKTNEIAYWRDRYNSQFAKRGDRLFVYGLELKSEVVGFALVFYFQAHSLVVFDHIAVKEASRQLGAFFEFKKLMAQDLLERNLQIDYVFAEIVTSKRGDPHPINSQLLIQLLKQSDFRVAHIEYYTPSIIEEEYGTKIETALLVRRNDHASQIGSRLLLSLIECVLDDLYIRWYTPHSKNIKAFKQQIEVLRSFYRDQLKNTEVVELNGNWKEAHVPVSTAKPPVNTRRKPTVKQPESEFRGLPATALIIFLVLLTSAALAGLSYESGFSAEKTLTFFIASLFALLVILGIWHRAAASQAKTVLRLLSKLLGHDKDVG